MTIQFVPRHFVPGIKFIPVRKRVSEYIASTTGPFQWNKDDCVIKGIAAIEQAPYGEVLSRFRLHRGVKLREVYRYLNTAPCYRWLAHKSSTVMGFAKANPRGRFVLLVSKHLVTVIDGVIMDDINSARMRVKSVWQWNGSVK